MSSNKGAASRFSRLHGGFFPLYDKRLGKEIQRMEPSYPRLLKSKAKVRAGKRRVVNTYKKVA